MLMEICLFLEAINLVSLDLKVNFTLKHSKSYAVFGLDLSERHFVLLTQLLWSQEMKKFSFVGKYLITEIQSKDPDKVSSVDRLIM